MHTISPASQQAKNQDQDHGGHQPQGSCSACPCKCPSRNPLVPACVAVGSPSPLGTDSMSCQRCSTSPHRPTFSLGCFFPTTAALTQRSNCPGPCMRAGQHGAGLVLSPVTQASSVELCDHQLSMEEGTRDQTGQHKDISPSQARALRFRGCDDPISTAQLPPILQMSG